MRALAWTSLPLALLLVGCGDSETPPADPPDALDADAADGAVEPDTSVAPDAPDAPDAAEAGEAGEAGDAGDAGDGADATESDAPDAAPACAYDAAVDAWADAERLGLPTVDVPVAPPIVTPQTAVSLASAHYRKAIGVLSLSPKVTDLQAVEHVLRPMGLPYQITTSPKLSVQHDMALFFPEASAGNFTPDELLTIGNHLASGGVVVQKVGAVAEMNKYGGVTSGTLRQAHAKLTLTAAGKTEFPSLDQPNEQEILLSGSSTEFLNTWDLALDPTATGATVLARFDDGAAAIVKNPQGAGAVYTFGVDLRDVVLRPQLGHNLYNVRGYVNGFDPGVDVWQLMIRDVYDAWVPFAVRLHTAPGDARAVAMFTHDLDWGPSYDFAVRYAIEEEKRGIRGTYFLHTKYVTDYQDVAFFDLSRGLLAQQIVAHGGAIGSHTVAHSVVLDGFPIGTGAEAYPAYAPYNVDKTTALGGSLFGELRVSKSLIDGLLAGCAIGHETVAFRAGELSYHMAAPQTMERLGYRFDSSRAIGDVINAFPYRQMTDWDAGGLDTSVFEFAISIEDELPPKLDGRAMAGVSVIAANADNGAPTTILIHPNVTDYKLAAQESMMDNLPAGVLGLDLETYGEFWRGRDAVTIASVDYDVGAGTLTVVLKAAEPVAGLSFHVSSWVKSIVSPSTAKLFAGPGGGLVMLTPFAAGETKTVVMTYVRP